MKRASLIMPGLSVSYQAKWLGMMIQTGLTHKQIADIFGITTDRLSSILSLNTRSGRHGRCEECHEFKAMDRSHDDYVRGIFRMLCASCSNNLHKK